METSKKKYLKLKSQENANSLSFINMDALIIKIAEMQETVSREYR